MTLFNSAALMLYRFLAEKFIYLSPFKANGLLQLGLYLSFRHPILGFIQPFVVVSSYEAPENNIVGSIIYQPLVVYGLDVCSRNQTDLAADFIFDVCVGCHY
jgi:hypothetical protein